MTGRATHPLPVVGIDVRRVSYVALTLPSTGHRPVKCQQWFAMYKHQHSSTTPLSLGLLLPDVAELTGLRPAVPSTFPQWRGTFLFVFISWDTSCMYLIRPQCGSRFAPGGGPLVETTPKESHQQVPFTSWLPEAGQPGM